MATVNVNHEGFQRRLDVIAVILRSYGLESTSVTPVEYLETCPYPYNNFIYKIQLSAPVRSSTFGAESPYPGTTSAPLESGASDALIIRLSNPHANGLNNAHRVENEVAAQYLFRQQLVSHYPEWAHLLPAIYAWTPCRYPEVPDESGFGWTICEFMPGVNLDGQFAEMELTEKLAVLEQFADIFAIFQRTTLPEGLTKGHLGGLTFDGEGQVVGGQMSILPPGPWQNYTDLWLSRLRQQLVNADVSSALKGWRKDGFRERIDKSVDIDTVRKLLEPVDTTQRALVHGDLTMNNMLFDPATKRVTALLDFDFSWVTHPAHEFITGFWDIGGALRLGDEKLQEAVLAGTFPETDSTALSPEARASWEVAKAWDNALAARGLARPASIRGIAQLEKLMMLEDALCPSQLGNEIRIQRLIRNSPTKLAETVKAATDKLTALLDNLDKLCT